VVEKTLRQYVAYLKQCLEDKEGGSYWWIEGKKIVADVLTKQDSRREALNEIIIGSWFRNALDEKNCVKHRDGEIRVENLIKKNGENTWRVDWN